MLALLATGAAQAAIPSSERQVLIDLYNSTNGDGWTDNTGWKTAGAFSAPGTECSWHGIACVGAGNNVTNVDLNSNHLVGTLPPTLNQLTALALFDVSYNELTGSIPPLAGLNALSYFRVNSNQLTGSIPSLTGLNALVLFDADYNQLSGSIPPLAGLTSLRYFYAFVNQLSGSIPPLAGLTALERFNVSANQLTGPIPPLTGLNALETFYVYTNQLTGTPPAAPTGLVAGQSLLCPNLLHTPADAGSDAAWNTAVGGTWSTDCTPGYVVTPSAGSGGSASPLQGVVADQTATLTFTPDAGYVVNTVVSTCGGTQNGNSFTTGPVTADCTVRATFKAAPPAASPTAVPTLGEWALALLGLLAAALGLRRLRRA